MSETDVPNDKILVTYAVDKDRVIEGLKDARDDLDATVRELEQKRDKGDEADQRK